MKNAPTTAERDSSVSPPNEFTDLQHNAALLTGLVETCMDAIVTVDDRQRIVLFNPAAEKMFGYPAAEVMGQPLSLLIPERVRAAHTEHIRQFGESGQTARAMGVLGEVRGVRRSGEEFPIEASITQVTAQGRRLFTAILRDTTRRRQAEEILRQERDKARQYLNVIEVMMLALDSEGRITLINRKGWQALGYDEDELIGRNWFATSLPASELEAVQAVFRKLMAGEVAPVEYFENSVLTKTGEQRLVKWHNVILRDETGQAVGTLSAGEDITERKEAEEKLRQQAALLDQTPDAILVCDLAGHVLYWNKGAESIYGWTAAEAAGKNVNELALSV